MGNKFYIFHLIPRSGVLNPDLAAKVKHPFVAVSAGSHGAGESSWETPRCTACGVFPNKEFFLKVKKLNLPIGEYALFGSAPMGVRGLRECRDIDIIVTNGLWKEFLDNFGWKLVKTQDKDKYSDGLERDGIELWKDWWPGWDVNKLIKEAEMIDGLPFVRLEKVLEWKKFIAKEKDLKDVELLEKFLLTKK